MRKTILLILVVFTTPNIYAKEKATNLEEYIIAKSQPTFKCDGRQYCSQMRSCAEAKFFIKNCPNTKMDGNNDGVPCEKQWCGYSH